ncbi:MAG TPA: hypothetical protein VFG41_01785 [Sphingomicrobium sp.]|jgi:hypothetical protein|nr:hypothetical protein [Sphingomicrobium sp.]
MTMVDEIYDRHYQAGRDEMNRSIAAGVGRFARSIGNAFEVLNRIEFESPWAIKQKQVQCN